MGPELPAGTNFCSVIYGALPPETKQQQAQQFNNREGNVKFLIATDAIGMGLNLNINRVILTQTTKFTKLTGNTELTQSEVKQIAGRAGRWTKDGEVSSFKAADLKRITALLDPESVDPSIKHLYDKEITKANLFPPFSLIEQLADDLLIDYDRSMGLHELLKLFKHLAQMDGKYEFKDISQEFEVAKAIHKIKGLTLSERFTICQVPVSTSKQSRSLKVLCRFAQQIALRRVVTLPPDMHLDA